MSLNIGFNVSEEVKFGTSSWLNFISNKSKKYF
jgi:hypothetical protein